MLTVFITSNQIPLHVHTVFCHNISLHVHCIIDTIDYVTGIVGYVVYSIYHRARCNVVYSIYYCIHLARGMMRMRIPSLILDHHGVVIKFQRSKYAASTGSLRLQVE